jgi:hypothetical protein
VTIVYNRSGKYALYTSNELFHKQYGQYPCTWTKNTWNQGCPDYLTPGGANSQFSLWYFYRRNFPGGLHPPIPPLWASLLRTCTVGLHSMENTIVFIILDAIPVGDSCEAYFLLKLHFLLQTKFPLNDLYFKNVENLNYLHLLS